LKRCGYPADIAKVVGFLVSDEAEWVNGKVIEIDGGAA
jgi:tetrahydroxynaphthalene reductase